MSGSTTRAIDPHAPPATNPAALIRGLLNHRQIIVQITWREVLGRYRGSAIGLAWSFFQPLFMLTVYTFVFSEVFKARWGGAGAVQQSKTQFAVLLFAGLIVLNLFSEVINRAPTLVIANVNFVKKVVFPIEVLPVTALGSALFHSCVSVAVLLCALLAFNGSLMWTVVFIPLVLLPLIVVTLGIAWILASLGVFLRDVGQTVSLLTTVLMFLSPVFYPVSAVPSRFRPFIMANPLTFIIEQARDVLIWGHMPDWRGLSIYMVCACSVAWAGYAWFQKTRKGFADVL